MERCLKWYAPDRLSKVADLGSASVNGSYRPLFDGAIDYTGFDLAAGPGVDIVLDDPHRLPIADASVDLVITGQMLEHCPNFWLVFREIARVLKDEAIAFVIAPSGGPIHRNPVDCYRFYPDAYQALADWSDLRLVDCWIDDRGPWNDLVGVFQKGGHAVKRTAPPPTEPYAVTAPPNPDRKAEVTAGARPYLEILDRIHMLLQPGLYVEIGVRTGKSIKLSKCRTIGIDPNPDLPDVPENVTLYRCTSDDFFFFHGEEALGGQIDLAFIDGCHLAEFAYRDFINIEKRMSRDGVIVIDDVFPNHPLQATRTRQTRVWCGDVWRFARLLAETRPDLGLTWLDSAPSGLLVIRGLKPHKRLLGERYNPFVRKLLEEPDPTVPPQILTREGAVAPTDDAIATAIGRPATAAG